MDVSGVATIFERCLSVKWTWESIRGEVTIIVNSNQSVERMRFEIGYSVDGVSEA